MHRNHTDHTPGSTVLRAFSAMVVAFLGPAILMPRITRALLTGTQYAQTGRVILALAVASCVSCGIAGLANGLLFQLRWLPALISSAAASVLTLILGGVVAGRRGVALNLPAQLGWAVVSCVVLFVGAIAGAWLRDLLHTRRTRTEVWSQ